MFFHGRGRLLQMYLMGNKVMKASKEKAVEERNFLNTLCFICLNTFFFRASVLNFTI